MIERLQVEGGRVAGVVDTTGYGYAGQTVVLATGTFLSGLVHIGFTAVPAGRAGEFASYGLPAHLRELGFELGRLKTGTPPRLKRASIDFARFSAQLGDERPQPFSRFARGPELPQLPSHIGYTGERAHAVVRRNLARSALYGGAITGTSARYCPSFEDKIVKFPEKERHQIILEPEGLDIAGDLRRRARQQPAGRGAAGAPARDRRAGGGRDRAPRLRHRIRLRRPTCS